MTTKGMVGVVEELLELVKESRDLARSVKERISLLEEQLGSGSVSVLVRQELEKMVSDEMIESIITKNLLDNNRLEREVKTFLILKEDYVSDLVRSQVITWINSVKDSLVSDIIRSEIDKIFEEDADTYYQEVARSLIDNKLFQGLLEEIVSEVTSRKIDEKLEVLEKLLSKKKVVKRSSTKSKEKEE